MCASAIIMEGGLLVFYCCKQFCSLFFSTQQNLASWNPSNPECLLLVVKELVQQYHQFQCSRLRESSRLMFEYQTLLEEPQYGENMEIYAGKKNNWVSSYFILNACNEYNSCFGKVKFFLWISMLSVSNGKNSCLTSAHFLYSLFLFVAVFHYLG